MGDISIFSRTLLKAQAIAMLIACVTINRKVIQKKPYSNQEETSETQLIFSDNQDQFWIFKAKIKAIKGYQSFMISYAC